MKLTLIVAALLVGCLLAFSGCSSRRPIEGVWEFVSSTYTTPDTTIIHDQSDWKAIKTITRSHFSTVGQAMDRPVFGGSITDADLVIAYNTSSANGGKYTIDNRTYTENLSFFTNPNRVGTSARLNYEIKGDSLVLYTVAGDVTWREVWRKLE